MFAAGISRWKRVLDGPAADFFHGDTFELVWPDRLPLDARQRAATQLLRALRCHVNELVYIDGYLPGLGLIAQRQADGQHAVAILGLDP